MGALSEWLARMAIPETVAPSIRTAKHFCPLRRMTSGVMQCEHKPEANRMNNDPRAHLRHYYDNPPSYALAIAEPWWWAVLGLGADVVNVHFSTIYRGSLAIVAGPQRWGMPYQRDVDAIGGILKAEKRPTFDAARCPKGRSGKIVGLVTVDDCLHDSDADSIWWSGPYGLRVSAPCLLPDRHAPQMSPFSDRLQPMGDEKKQSLEFCLTHFAAMPRV